MTVRVGIDLVSVEQVREAIAEHGDRYLDRVYTPTELADSGRVPERLAARFAAKEATMKALGRNDEGMGYTNIGVRREASGQPEIELSGPAATLAQERGLRSIAVSLTHEDGYAAAVVMVEAAAAGRLTPPPTVSSQDGEGRPA